MVIVPCVVESGAYGDDVDYGEESDLLTETIPNSIPAAPGMRLHYSLNLRAIISLHNII